MLVMTRREGEEVMITDTISVVIVRIDGNKVRLGFKAPEDVRIYRRELYERIKEMEHAKHSEAGSQPAGGGPVYGTEPNRPGGPE